MKFIADDKIPFLKGILEPFAEVAYFAGNKITVNDLNDVDALLIRTRTKCTEKLLRGTPVKFIGTATIGFDHIDTEYCDKNNICWTNAPGCNSGSVKQYITAALLMLEHDHNFALRNKTIGIVGSGNVGTKVEKAAKALGMNVLINDPPRERVEGSQNFVTFDTILNESDVVSLHVPLNMAGEDKTWHLFNDDVFNRLKKRPCFINSSRGEVVETQALKRAMSSGKISGSILDVWENEPDIDRELMEASFIATPHIAGYSTDGKANGTAMVVNSLSRFFKLPLTDWYPVNIPPPDKELIEIDCAGKEENDILREAVVHSYDIVIDAKNLRNSPSDFEKLRGDYRLRREFSAYTVKLKGCNEATGKLLADIGFKVE